ncbi:MAG: hypothetical protein KF745_00070 [Phycisphaeraceae bacterium]|nr:hypothetical protein [Phycisphaeraceae bacterium]
MAASGAMAQINTINSFRNNFRNFNDFPNSNLVASSNYGAGTVSISENNFGQGNTPTAFANRHRVLFSNNGGANNYALQNSQSFDLSFDLNLTATAVRLAEAGFYSDTFVGGEPRYIAKAGDAVFAFDAWLPFVFAGGYVNGTTTNMRFAYNAGDGAANTIPATVTVYRDAVNLGTFNAGNFAAPDFLNGYADGSIFGFYATFSPIIDANGLADPNASASLTLSNIQLVPAPGAAATLALASLVAIRRRRR